MAFTDEKHTISLLIEDDGRAFDVEEVLAERDPLSGYGLIAMHERREIFVERAPGTESNEPGDR